MMACGGAAADYVENFDVLDQGGGYWFYSYVYNRAPETTLISGQSTWTLSGLYGLDAPGANVTGPTWWDEGVIDSNYRSVTWTYTDPEGTDPGVNLYAFFEVILYNPNAHHTLVDWTSDPGNDGPIFSGQVVGGVPEPGTMALVALGIGALAARARRQRS